MSSSQYRCNTCGNTETFMESKIVHMDFIPDDEGGTKVRLDTVTVGICTSCKGTAESVQETKARDKKKRRPYSTKRTTMYRKPDNGFFEGVDTDTDHVLELATGKIWRKSKLFKVAKNKQLLAIS